jgi:hypothetical protein
LLVSCDVQQGKQDAHTDCVSKGRFTLKPL